MDSIKRQVKQSHRGQPVIRRLNVPGQHQAELLIEGNIPGGERQEAAVEHAVGLSHLAVELYRCLGIDRRDIIAQDRRHIFELNVIRIQRQAASDFLKRIREIREGHAVAETFQVQNVIRMFCRILFADLRGEVDSSLRLEVGNGCFEGLGQQAKKILIERHIFHLDRQVIQGLSLLESGLDLAGQGD